MALSVPDRQHRKCLCHGRGPKISLAAARTGHDKARALVKQGRHTAHSRQAERLPNQAAMPTPSRPTPGSWHCCWASTTRSHWRRGQRSAQSPMQLRRWIAGWVRWDDGCMPMKGVPSHGVRPGCSPVRPSARRRQVGRGSVRVWPVFRATLTSSVTRGRNREPTLLPLLLTRQLNPILLLPVTQCVASVARPSWRAGWTSAGAATWTWISQARSHSSPVAPRG
ncbi:hypothetical protein CPBF367_04710 [Xanthomonas arboricola pv. juglandis]|nr:hypothetical protein CPBF367_04710 [Xanthomonas arboricola pv. juglandis]